MKDQIIELAKQAGFEEWRLPRGTFTCSTIELQRFAELVRNEAQQPALTADVPMLTDEEIKDAIRHLYKDETALQMSIDITRHEFRAIEQAVHQKAGLK